MNWKKFRTLIKEGRGQGHGENYRPWLQLRRGNSSDRSTQHLDHLPGWRRPFHLLAHSTESHMALIAAWLGVADIREQYPLWPWRHPHPLEGSPHAAGMSLPWCRGMLDIASDLQVAHGNYVGADVPEPVTIDLMLTVIEPSPAHLVAVAMKPSTFLADTNPDALRAWERLQLAKQYCEEAGIRFVLLHEQCYPPQLAANLLWFKAAAFEFSEEDLERFAVLLNACQAPANDPIRAIIDGACAKADITRDDGQRAFCAGAWYGIFDVDLSRQIVMSWPIPRDNGRTRAMMWSRLTGQSAC